MKNKSVLETATKYIVISTEIQREKISSVVCCVRSPEVTFSKSVYVNYYVCVALEQSGFRRNHHRRDNYFFLCGCDWAKTLV